MNQTFDHHRFAMMLKIDFAEKGKTYLLTSALLLFALLLMMVPVTLSNEFHPFREVLHYMSLLMILLFGGSLLTAGAFSQYSNPSTGIAALMLPASRLEKFLSSLVLNLAFIVPFLIIFWQLHYLLYDIANANLTRPLPKYRYIPIDYMRYACFGYFVFQAAVFLGSIYFAKASYIKTAAVFVGIGFILALLNYLLAVRLTDSPSQITAFPFSGWKLWYYPTAGKVNPYSSIYYQILPPQPFGFATQVFIVAMAVLLWTAAYFQMKEREI